MLRATFLGHQGWLLSTARTHVLVDPLLTDGFGHGGLAGTVFPPRRFHFERMPAIDAVWLTHEHDDHFDIPSLMLLDRSVPIYASSRSSVALYGVLQDLGFTVHPVEPNDTVEVGDLTIQTFVADHRATPLADEWDVLPFLATDAVGGGAFASSVDVAMPGALLDAVNSMLDRRWMLCLANNTTDVRFVRRAAGRVEPCDDTEALAGVLRRRLAACPRPPDITAITGGGWSHPDDVAWIDRIAFCVDPDRLASSLGAPCSAVRPGDVVSLTPDGVYETTSPWIGLTARASRPSPSGVDVPDDVAPASGQRHLERDAWPRLEVGLREFARFLFARDVFTAAHASRAPHALAFVLRDDAEARTYAWSPSSAGFERVNGDEALSGFEVWATDLLALFEGELAPSALCYTGRVRCWNDAPEQLRVSPQLLWTFAHPLHRPDVARHLYSRLVAGRD